MTELFLAIELDGTGIHPASWRREDSRAEDLFTGGYWVDAITAAEKAGLDAVFLPDSFALQPGGHGVTRGVLDAIAISARVAAATRRIGLIPQAPVTHTEPFHLAKAIQSLDYASLGRAGWEVTVSQGAEQAAFFGRKQAQDPASLWREADEAIEVVTRLWDSWEDDAEIRDVPTGRFIDRDKLHYIDFTGEHFSVKGPSITPRSPQGQPIVAVRADDTAGSAVAARRADLIRIAAADLDSAHVQRNVLRTAIHTADRNPDAVQVLLDIDIHLADSAQAAQAELAQLDRWAPITTSGPAPRLRHIGTAASLRELLSAITDTGAADGVVLRPLAASAALQQLTAAPLLGTPPRVRIPTPGADPFPTLRTRLGLPRPTSRYAARNGAPA
ncbi:LLM class flavin-dependent oxidoreductase [Nocardia sp. CA-107356]|uniref:LLM class flavin-dependent oxidoreductase n=1 Tax=Nocardia sp. CA-107356 TaxID=3239972 RepID=UPI003D932869